MYKFLLTKCDKNWQIFGAELENLQRKTMALRSWSDTSVVMFPRRTFMICLNTGLKFANLFVLSLMTSSEGVMHSKQMKLCKGRELKQPLLGFPSADCTIKIKGRHVPIMWFSISTWVFSWTFPQGPTMTQSMLECTKGAQLTQNEDQKRPSSHPKILLGKMAITLSPNYIIKCSTAVN